LSKISEKLTKLGHTERSGFGFGASSASTKIPVILVGVSIESPGDASEIDADLIVMSVGKAGSAQTSGPKDADLWGVTVSGGSSEEIDAAIEAGADFIVAEGESAPGAALRDDDSGKGYIVDSDVSEDRVKAIEAGPFDFLILDGTKIEFPLNVGSILEIQEQLAKYSRHIFLQMTSVPDQGNLELLRDIGISALIYDGKTAASAELKLLRGAIDQLEPKKPKSGGGAVLPHSGDSSSQDQDDDFEEHDHEEDWE
jgi:hypothetical protein